MQRKTRVLVVEGPAAQGVRISEVLAYGGYAVDTAATSSQALNKMLEYFDVVVVDARAEGNVIDNVAAIKGRVAGAAVLVAGTEDVLKSIRFLGRLRADGFVTLCGDRVCLVSEVQGAYERTVRHMGGEAKRMAHAA